MTMEDYKVTIPEGELGPWKIERFTINRDSFFSMRLDMEGRSPGEGEFTRIMKDGALWMSDTRAEYRDHMFAIAEIRHRGGRILIHGLGIGMVLQAALLADTVTHVDVVEIDPDVIALVGPHYEKMAAENGVELNIVCDDALTHKWPTGSYWDVIWHDIWRDMTEDNLPDMHRLHRSFGRRCFWQGSWGRESIEYQKRRTADAWWR